MPQRKLKLNFRPSIQVSQSFADWLERMIDPVADDRFQSADDALAVLLGKRTLAATTQTLDRPSRSPITFLRDDNQLLIKIPPTWLRSAHSRLLGLLPLASTSFLLVMIWLILASGYYMTPASWLLLGSYGSISLWMAARFLISAASQTCLEISASRVRLRRSLWGMTLANVDATPSEIIKAELQPTQLLIGKTPITACVMKVKRSCYRFGFFLTESEKAWLISEIAQFVQGHETAPTTNQSAKAFKHSP